MFDGISLNLDNSIGVQQLDDNAFREYLYGRVKEILVRYFPEDVRKQSIKIHKNRLQFACPFCGDSARDSSKKRGSIILEGKFKYFYKCHNCGELMDLKTFFSRLKCEGMSLSAIDYIGKTKDLSITSYRENVSKTKQLLFDIDYIESISISREMLKSNMLLVECAGTYAATYLNNRCIYDFSRFLYNIPRNQLVVLNLTPSGKIFGYQVRNLSSTNDGSKYLSFNIENIDRLIHNGYSASGNLDDYNQLSMTFNILNINFTKPIIVTEGPIDSFLLNNAIAMCGAAKTIPLDLDFYYMFDSDSTGKQHAMDSLNKGKRVFLWDKFIKDYNLPKQKKWDWNDAVKYFKKNGMNIPNVIPYFSNNFSDLFYI